MKKLITAAALITLAISIFSINGTDIAAIGEVDEENIDTLIGADRQDIIKAWGKPDGVLSGLWGEIWWIGRQSDRKVILYYSAEDGEYGKNGVVQNAKLSYKTYVYGEGDEQIIPPCFTLKDDGTFRFTFSPLSSYIGTGKYEMAGDVLVLCTSDGKYQYYFDKTDGGFAFKFFQFLTAFGKFSL